MSEAYSYESGIPFWLPPYISRAEFEFDSLDLPTKHKRGLLKNSTISFQPYVSDNDALIFSIDYAMPHCRLH